MDYQKLTMKFMHYNKLVELKGTVENDKVSLSLTQLQQFVQTGGAAQLYSLQVKPFELAQPHVQLEHDDGRIQILLCEFSHLFPEPTSLPPQHLFDHSIPFLSTMASVNVKPYCYPHVQKLEIEQKVEKLLANGWILSSTSPFYSPVLLLKKKDG